jgi:hypothetical protein
MQGLATMPRRGDARTFHAAIDLRVRANSARRGRVFPWARRGLGAHGGSAEGSDSDRSRRTRRTRRNDLAPPPVSISTEYTVVGSPQDERLCREQTRAVIDLLSDIIQRRNARAA